MNRSFNYLPAGTTRVLFALVLLVACDSKADSQSVWTWRGQTTSLEVEYLRPLIKEKDNLSSVNILTFSTRLAAGDNTWFIFEFPFVSVAATPTYFVTSGLTEGMSAVGNPYFGVEYGAATSLFFGELGFRAPLVTEPRTHATDAGVLGDFDRYEAYTPNMIQVGGAVNAAPKFGGGFGSRLRLGPTLDIVTRDTYGTTELFASYAVILTFQSEIIDAGAGFVGKAIVTKSSPNASIDHLESSIRMHFGNVHPGLQLRAPLDDGLKTLYEIELGANVAVEL